MKGNLKRILSAFLALTLVLSCMPTVFAAEAAGTAGDALGGPLSLTAPSGNADREISFAPQGEEESEADEEPSPEPTEAPAAAVTEGLPKFEPSEQERFSESEAAKAYGADDIVTFIVVTEEKPQLELFSVSDIAAQTASVQSHQSKQISALNDVQAKVKLSFGKEEGFKMGFTYTIATTGFSVTTAYGNKGAIEKMAGVKSVYVAPTFALPETLDAEPYTNNASTMIGADVLNSTGYTGKGMRIAILDTGILLDHPNFAALSEDKLVDPMTRESVEAVWKTLNAGQMTDRLNVSYHSSKIPFAFNYSAGDFNVDNTYAHSDHGTHVAGISAANKVDGSSVIGVAPDAQLVVMQVFESTGGANWATIMAALEDCVRLEVDAANLSLGAAAGYTDPADDMLEVLNLFKESDIQVLIASGNDTSNAYMNAWGLDMSLISNPDIGLAGTPSTYTAALGVASVDNDGYEQLYFTVDGVDYGFQDSAAAAETIFINNFRDQTLEYVVVPGVGQEADYEGLDVTGKIALISRGTTSFPEKQATAQAHGAVGCVIYNNAIGLFLMQINDGEGNIPAVSIGQAAGQAMIAAAGDDGVGTMTVCNADMKLFNVDRTVSSFSSWGVTPDLKLKPEISGVGGSIYATVDPAISGSYYGPMSGTSMATPQITGAMAVLIQYLDENYPEITGSAQRRLAANLLMSTADPVMASSELEYSPRAQGAGLANLVSATATPAYLSNSAASEGRPKVEFGDDPNKTGVYEFSFEINNLSDEALVYGFDSSVMTESIYADYFIANSPYALEAKVETPDQVTVPANGSVTVNATLTLTAADKAYLDKFPNGIYVEGFLYATPAGDNAEGVAPVELVMPMVGFYGDWSAAPIFDDPVDYSLYPTVVYTYNSQLGTNPYFRNGASGEEYNSFSYVNPLAEVDFGMLRNAKRMDITVTNAQTGEVYHTLDGSYMTKSYYSASYGQVIPTYLMIEYGEVWDCMDANGNRLPDGTEITYKFEAWLDDGDDVMDDSWSFNAKLDTIAPEVLNDNDLQSALRMDETTGRSYLTLEIQENQHIAALIFQSESGAIMGKYELDNTPGETYTGEYEITGFGNEFTIIVADYACNETEVEVMLNLGDQNNAEPQPAELSKDRLYGNETFDGALVEGGWFSANKADFSDPRNETFDSSNRYYSAEYVNGYLIAQSAATGNLELITPTGSYWSAEVLCQNSGNVGQPNVWVLYDMALDHSGTLTASYGVNWETNATDGLFAVGWQYKGDQDNDGKDDGYNALFNIKFTSYGSVLVQEIARISGTDGAELLTLGITTEGDVYGIATNGVLYSVAKSTEWDASIGQWGENVIKCTPIGETSFVSYPGYGGANVIQSMGYDHNTGTMYWYAHSQVASGYTYNNINVTYKVDLDTAACTEVGTYGPGGQTCLFVPNDLESDLFTMGGEPSGLSIDPGVLTMVAGQISRLKIAWQPWSASAVDVVWASADETIATVDEYGFVTAHAAGNVSITATATVNVEPYWGYDENGNWVQFPGGPTETTVGCNLTVVPAQDALYGFAVEDFNTGDMDMAWYTYSDTAPAEVTSLGTSANLWQGGTYYNGYVYTVAKESWEADGVIYQGSVLYRSTVTKGETPAQTVIGAPARIGTAMDVELGNLGFDYNTGRMYGVDLTNGGLAIIDLETGEADLLGTFSGDCGGPIIATAMCVTADGTIIIADMYSNLYKVNPDTLATTTLYSSGADSWYYAAMCYDYNTGNIYWNPCMSDEQSPLNLVILPANEWDQATIVDMGDVGGKKGSEQTVMFTIPDNEPQTQVLPVESIEIADGDTVTGLAGGTMQLSAVTVPARPTVQTKTWTSSDESVVTVDRFGKLTYKGVGTATVTVSITNKDEATYGGPFTDSVEVTVLEAAGEFVAFLGSDEGGTGYYDFWMKGNDYDLRHTSPTESMIAIYSLRSGAYYDGYFYGYNDKGSFMRIDADDPANFKLLGEVNLDVSDYQVTAMAMDYTTGTMYGLTLPSNYSFSTWASEEHPGELVTIDLNTGLLTTVATLDFTTPVYALACDADGQLYAAGGTFDYYATATNLYKLDKQTGVLTAYTVIEGANVYTGNTYYGTAQYNAQMAYDCGTDRLYLYATTDYYNYTNSFGMYMIQLGDEPTVADLGGISLYTRVGSDIKYGEVYLGLLAFLPEADEIPAAPVNGIILNTNATRVAVDKTTQLVAQVRPSNASDLSVTWSVADESVATVDQNGLVTGVSLGATTVTVTSNQTGITAECQITVVDVSGPQSVAYTVSAKKDSLISFNPAIPAQTANVVSTLSGGSTISGMAYGNDCLYYVQEVGYSYYLYRYDFTTKKSTEMGSIEAWTGVDGIAYDKDNNLLYAVGGFYLFQYDMSTWEVGGNNSYSNYIMDSDYCTLAGVSVIDGAVYVFGNDYYTSVPRMIRYSDKYLTDRTIVLEDLGISLVPGSTDIAYEPNAGLFYLADAGHTIHTLDMDGTLTTVDLLGDGLDLCGLAIDPTLKYAVTYTDGVDGKTVFADQVYFAAPGAATPAFTGTPTREGYTFAGWTPEIAESVTDNASYAATWTPNTYSLVLVADGGTVDPTYVTVTYDQPIGQLPVPVRAGYVFDGWFDNDGNLVTADTRYTWAGMTSVTARWTEAEVLASGWSGYTTWKLTEDGALIISPSGQNFNGKVNMRNYWKQNGVLTLPWGAYADQITTVVVEEGVNAIGQMAFYGLENLQTVTLADSVEEVRNYAFKNCSALTTVNGSENVQFIREGAFYGCSALSEFVFADGCTVEEWAFSRTGVTAP